MTSESREKAIHWLEWELRSLRRAPDINGCPMTPEWAEQISVLETCLEAVKDYHIGESTEMIPLTLEQLRKMDGQPVWCKSLINGKSEWAIIRIVEMSKTWFIALAGASQGFGDKDTYGKTWLAHAYPPAHIDREAWTAEWRELHGDKLVGFDDCGDDVYRHYHYSVCTSCGKGSAVKSNFCPKCGKAMTPEAWAELEKRVRV